MSRQISKRSSLNPHTAALRGVFAPTLLCLALFSATSAMAARSGGYDGVPCSDCYGNVESLTGNNVQITEENDLYRIYGAYARHETSASVSDNTVTISGSRLPTNSYAHGGAASAGNVEQPTSLIAVLADAGSPGAASATANGNKVSILNGTSLLRVYGGLADATGDSGSTATANGNGVLISESSEVDYAFGAYAQADGTGALTATANNNTLTVENATAQIIYGAQATSYAHDVATTRVTANSNLVSVSGTSAVMAVWGGRTDSEIANDSTAEASDNNVSLNLSAESNAVNQIFGGSVFTYDGIEGEAGELRATASRNQVTLTGDTKADIVGGGDLTVNADYVDGFGTANENTLALSGNALATDISAGRAFVLGQEGSTATASSNIVRLSEHASVVNQLRSGYAEAQAGKFASATVSENVISLEDQASVAKNLYAGYAVAEADQESTATAKGNSVQMSGTATVGREQDPDSARRWDSDLYGGHAESVGASSDEALSQKSTAIAEANSVTLTDEATAFGEIYGGEALASDSTENIATATGNSVALTGHASAEDDIQGGYAWAGYGSVNVATASENTVALSDEAITQGNVFGGYASAESDFYDSDNDTSLTATAENNSVVLSRKVSAQGDILGGYAEAYVHFGSDDDDSSTASATATAENNRVEISGGEVAVNEIYGGNAYASVNGANTASATMNRVIISEGATISGLDIRGNILGGYAAAYRGENNSAEAVGNTIILSGAARSEAYLISGGNAEAVGEGNNTARASENSVIVSDGSVADSNIVGGYTNAYGINHNALKNEEYATGNTVVIDGAEIVGDDNFIVGGLIYIDGEADLHIATGNTVTLTGAYRLDESTSIYGSLDWHSEDPRVSNENDDLFTGNTLNLDARKVLKTTVNRLGNFETINIQAGDVKAGDTVLEASEAFLGNGQTGDAAKKTTVNLLSIESGDLKAGDTLTLISGVQEAGGLANDGEKQFVRKGESFAVGYEARIAEEEGPDSTSSVTATIEGKTLNSETKIFVENRAASLALLAGGADILEDADIGKGRNVFGVIQGGHSRYSTGSHVEVDGLHLATGLANTWSLAKGDLTGAAFIEAGWGDTDTYNSIGGKSLHGSGDSHYYGVGALGRFELTEGSLAGLYTEGALRIGKLWSDYKNGDARNVRGEAASYDISSAYYAAHVGLGYEWALSEKLKLDTSAKYLWTRVASKNVTILSDDYHFDAMDSSRIRLGAKLEYLASAQCTPYLGLAYEHEFDGKAKGSVEGMALPTADLGGDTGIFSAGVDFKPSKSLPLTVKAAFTGYVGEHRGAAGLLKVRYDF